MDMYRINIVDGDSPVSRIYVGDSLKGVSSCIPDGGPVFVVYDNNASAILSAINDLEPAATLGITVSEQVKTVETVVEICSWLLENGADRNAFLLAVGGGILTDMAGFAAAVYKRGIKTGYIPTTLLSQVDASIGGKTGVNLHGFKNILGVIRQPEFTYISAAALETLPYRDFLSGVAEMLKTFVIQDNGNYHKAVGLFRETHSADDIRLHRDALNVLIREAATVKARVVSADQFESGLRRKLNLGHTFAHAIEWCTHEFSHGEAVAIGIVCAARLSEAMGLCKRGLAAQLEHDFKACGLPVDMPCPIDVLAEAMGRDKKAENGKIHFILIKEIGDVAIVELAVDEVVKMLK